MKIKRIQPKKTKNKVTNYIRCCSINDATCYKTDLVITNIMDSKRSFTNRFYIKLPLCDTVHLLHSSVHSGIKSLHCIGLP